MKRSPVALVLALGALANAAAAQQLLPTDVLPAPRAPFVIEVENVEVPSIVPSLDQLDGATGLRWISTWREIDDVDARPATPIRDLTVPSERFWPVCEALFLARGACLAPLPLREPRLLLVAPVDSPRFSDALRVPASSIGGWAEHPAILVSTLYRLRGIRGRTAVGLLVSPFEDPPAQSLIPLGHAVVVTGTASNVARWIRLLERIDRSGSEVAWPEDDRRGAKPEPSGETIAPVIPEVLLPVRVGKLVVPSARGTEATLSAVLGAAGPILGRGFEIAPEVQGALERQKTTLGAEIAVEPRDVPGFLATLLYLHDFEIGVPSHPEAPLVIGAGATRFKPDHVAALEVDAPSLERWSALPAVRIRTRLDLAALHARDVSNAWSPALLRTGVQLLHEGASTLLVEGPAHAVAWVAACVRDADAHDLDRAREGR